MPINIIHRFTRKKAKPSINPEQALLGYYSQASTEYFSWSKNYNMHFGYFESGMNPFDREAQLQMMNRQVLDRLELSSFKNNRVLDLGCGLGATVRYAAGRYPVKYLIGISIVKQQVEKAIQFISNHLYSYSIKLETADYEATPYRDESFDGIYAIESIRHATDKNRQKVLKEIYRLLKPGKRIVIADGFLKPSIKANSIFKFCLKKMCRSWAINELADIQLFQNKMEEIGFNTIEVKEVSWNIACSALHIPYISIKYLITRILFSKQIFSKQRWNHFLGPIFSLVVGLHRNRFGYYIVTAKK